MTKISISIPDSLMAKLEPIKDSINISQLCREALEQRVAAFNRTTEGNGNATDQEDPILRLRGERGEFEGRFERLGMEGAVTWLASAPYPDVKTVTESGAPSSMVKYRLPRAAFKVMKRDMEGANADCEGPHAEAYKAAWLEHVMAVWAQIVDGAESTGGPEPSETVEAIEEDGA
jgi:hypothetical protein